MPKNTAVEKEKKRRVVAKGKMAGAKRSAIARAAKCSTRHVDRLAAEPETQFLITEALRPHQAQLRKLATKAISAISAALLAKKGDKADHFNRLKAVERFGDVLSLAQGGKPPELAEQSGTPQYTWEEFTVLYGKRVTVAKADLPNQAPSH